MDEPSTTGALLSTNGLITRAQLSTLPTPDATLTHKPIPHDDVITKLYDALSIRKINITKDQYAISNDGMKCYWTMDIDTGFSGGNFIIGGRNSHDKSLALSLVIGYRVLVCDNGCFSGDYTPLMKKHTKHFNLDDAYSLALDQMLRNFKPLTESIERWRATSLNDDQAKLHIYDAFYGPRATPLPKYLMQPTHDHYFIPRYEEFQPRNLWSLNNAFTSSIQQLEPIPQERARAAIGEYFKNKQL